MSRWSPLLIVALVIAVIAIARVGAAQTFVTSEILNRGLELGDWNKTERLVDQTLKRSPDNVGALIARARLRALYGMTPDAISDCDKLLDAHPRPAQALAIRGALLCDNGQVREGRPISNRIWP